MKCRTVQYGDSGGIAIVETDVRDPGPGEVRIRSSCCGICTWDIATYKVGLGPGGGAPPGHEGVGYIEAVGDGERNLKEGMRVTAFECGFCELTVCRSSQVYVLPDSPLADEFWLVEPASCVVTGLDTAPLKAGDRVAVVGCGFMGLMFVEALSRFYHDGVVAVDLNSKRLGLAQRLGSTETVDAGAPDLDAHLQELHRRGIDVVFDCSGSAAGLDLSSRIVRQAGHISLFGCIRGQATIDGMRWHGGGFSLTSSSPSARVRDPFPPAIRMLDRGHIDLRPLVSHVASLDDCPELFRRAAAGEDDYLKGVVRVS